MKKTIIFLALAQFSFGQSPFLVEEPFTSAPTAPTGWTFSSGISNYTSGTNSGKSPNSVKFGATGDKITSKNWGGGGDQLSFMMRGTNTPNTTDVMLVEVYNGSSWSTLANARPHTTARTFIYTISTSITQARFTYTKSGTNVAFDDFTIRQSGKCSGTGPYITAINVDACGTSCEGKDEFFTFFTGSTAMNLSDIEVSYPDANTSSVTWCGSSANPCDNYITTNSAEVSALNSLAGCTVFITPTTSIPAYAPVMVFNGNPQNTRTNFGSLCSGGTATVQYYALFANNTTDCNGRFGNNSSTAGCTPECYRGLFIRDRSTGCTDTNYYYKDAIANNDGASVTYASAGASPAYVNTNCNSYLILPVSLLSFYGVNEQSKINLYWETQDETDLQHYNIERSTDGNNFQPVGKVSAVNSKKQHRYVFSDIPGGDNTGGYYYKLSSVDMNGSKQYYRTVFIPIMTQKEDIRIVTSTYPAKIFLSDVSPAEKSIEVIDLSGQVIWSDTFSGGSYELPPFIPDNKFCFVRVTDDQKTFVRKVIFSKF